MNAITTLDAKFHTLKDSYKLVKTRDLITKIESLGYNLDNFVANKTRKVEKQGFQKHRAIFSSDLLKTSHNDEGKLQLLLTNSHDGTSSVILSMGFYRLVCSNGLVIGNTVETIRLPHKGQFIHDNIERAIEKIAAQADNANNDIAKMRSTNLSKSSQNELFYEASKLRFPEKQVSSVKFNINRYDDRKDDLFTVYNVAQENLIRGGSSAMIFNEETKLFEQKTLRAIKSIDSQTKLNTDLYNLAMKFAA